MFNRTDYSTYGFGILIPLGGTATLLPYHSYSKGGITLAISTTLKQVRTERNICQEDLATAIGSCGRTIGRIERGERNASLELALRISQYLGISVEELFKIEE